MGVSASYLSRKFKEITGQTFLDFLNKYRVQQAITLLNTREYRISEISEAVVFLIISIFVLYLRNIL